MDDNNFEHRLTKLEADMTMAFRRIDELRDRQSSIDDLSVSLKQLAIREENVESALKEIKADVKSLTNKPAERWNDLVKTIISVVVAGVVGYMLAKVGFK